MGCMNKYFGSTVIALVIVLGLIPLASAQDDDGPMSNIRFVVVRDYNGKPVRNAAVILHPVNKKGKQSRGGLELKTDGDGKTNIDGIPYGPLRIQVLATGFQTFGDDYQIDKPETEIVVKIKRPGGQYSVYENRSDAPKPADPKAAAPQPTAPKPQ
jgi:Carboxypeptidase regulatory-like domain